MLNKININLNNNTDIFKKINLYQMMLHITLNISTNTNHANNYVIVITKVLLKIVY